MFGANIQVFCVVFYYGIFKIPTSYSPGCTWCCFYIKDTKSFGRDISISILKDVEIFPQVLSKWINDFVSTHAYWIPLKLVGTISNDKKEDNSDKVLSVKKYLTFDTKSLWKNYMQPSVWLHTISWYSACTFLMATAISKGTWWIMLYRDSFNEFIKSQHHDWPISKLWGLCFCFNV